MKKMIELPEKIKNRYKIRKSKNNETIKWYIYDIYALRKITKVYYVSYINALKSLNFLYKNNYVG